MYPINNDSKDKLVLSNNESVIILIYWRYFMYIMLINLYLFT